MIIIVLISIYNTKLNPFSLVEREIIYFAISTNVKYNNYYTYKGEIELKKVALLLMLLLLCLIFVGCTTVTMEYNLDIDNNLQIKYNVVFDKTTEEIKDFSYYNLKNDITNHWETQGFTVEVEENDDELSFIGFLEEQHSTRKEAYESLNSILKGEYSPFTSTGFEYASSYFEDEYNLIAEISLKDLLRRSEYQVIPSDVQETLTKYANESKFALLISLPGEAVETNSDSQDYDNSVSTNTWNLKYGDEKELKLKTIIVNDENVEYHKNLTDSTNQNKIIFLCCGGGAALVLIAFLIIFFVRKSRIKNQSNTDLTR